MSECTYFLYDQTNKLVKYIYLTLFNIRLKQKLFQSVLDV